MEGKKREIKRSNPEIGVFEGKVIAINPDKSQMEKMLGTEIDKEPDYFTKSKEGDKGVRISIWLKDVNEYEQDKKFNLNFFLQENVRYNKDKTKVQYINSAGACTWGLVEKEGKDLPTWFTHFTEKSGKILGAKDFRKALVGEEELMTFVRNWLDYDIFDLNTKLLLDTEKLLKNNMKELEQEINGEFATNVVCMATVRVVNKEGESGPVTNTYQSVYNKAFAPGYTFKQFKGIDFTDDRIKKMTEKKKLELFERFILSVVNPERGCKDNYYIGIKKEFNSEEFVNTTEKVLDSEDSDY